MRAGLSGSSTTIPIRAGGRGLENRRPARDLGLHQAIEGRRVPLRLGRDRGAQIAQPFLHRRIVERLVECGRELVDDLLRHALGREDAGPDAHVVVDSGLLGGRDVGQRRQALGGGDAVGLDLAALDLLGHAHRLLAQEIDVAADQVVHRRPGAAIGHERRLEAELRGEQQARHVRGGADAAMRLLHLVAVLLQIGHELRHRLGGKIIARGDHRRGVRGEADRLEVLRGIVFEIRREHRRGHVRSHAAGEQGVAVRRCGGDARAAERAAGAADILDHQLVAERPAHMVGDDARHHVARPAGRERHHHGDGARRIALCRSRYRRGRQEACCDKRNRQGNGTLHGTPPLFRRRIISSVRRSRPMP